MSQGVRRMSWFLFPPHAPADADWMAGTIPAKARGERTATPEPALILLANDAHRPGCRRLHCFEDAEDAARFVRFWYPYRSDESVVGFWLLGTEPLPVDRAEWDVRVLILVRGSTRGTVYAYTRPDMESARRFVSEETGYGLNPASVLLFWAVPALLETDVHRDTVIFPRSLPEGAASGNAAVTALAERVTASAIVLR